MKRKYIKLNNNNSHLSIGNITNLIKEESKNKSSAIQEEVFCSIFDVDYINTSTVNNYCIGARSIGSNYKQKYIVLKKKYEKDESVFIDIVCNILTIINGSIYDIKNIKEISENNSLQNICNKLYNISKNDFYVTKDYITKFKNLLNQKKYYNLFVEFLIYSILEKKQPLYEDEQTQNIIETLLENTDISVYDLQDFLLLELNEGINFSHSLRLLAQKNNPYANYRLATMEYRGEFTGYPRYDKAFHYFSLAAENNHPSACWMLGNMIIRGKIGNKNYKEAINYFEKAKNLGNKAAINSLGLCYKYGYGVKQNNNKALELFKEGAKKNYVYSLNNLGIYYEENGEKEKALNYFMKSANLLESFACNKVGEYYRNNNDYKTAFDYYNKALESSMSEKSSWAYYNLAKYYYLNGETQTCTAKDLDKAIKYFELSNSLIESLIELLKINYIFYINTQEEQYLKKVYLYKKEIEAHPNYDDKINQKINSILKNIYKKRKIEIPLI